MDNPLSPNLGQPQRQQDSVMQQLEHLGHELSALDEAIQSLHSKASVIMRPATPECSMGENAKEVTDFSPMMEVAVDLTKRARRIKAYIIRTTDEMQI